VSGVPRGAGRCPARLSQDDAGAGRRRRSLRRGGRRGLLRSGRRHALLPTILAILAATLLLAGCGSGDPAQRPAAPATKQPSSTEGQVLVAALGDSINAGSPLWDPNPQTRAAIGARIDERSQWEYWAARRNPRVRFRNCGVFGERTDEIAARLDRCAGGARALVVQGGINDIVQGRPVDAAARDLEAMVRRGKARGLGVVLVEVLPWNNGYPQAAPFIEELNRRIGEIGRRQRVGVLPWFRTLQDPAKPGRMSPQLTEDGDHPSVEGYRRLAATVRLPVGSAGR
jgi:lysophospholipase L1-like esterase